MYVSQFATKQEFGSGNETKQQILHLHFAPFLVFPSPFPEQEFARSLEIQPILNELMHKVAHDRTFLTETLKNTIQVDEFTRKLFEIYETVQNEGVAQVSKIYLFYSMI